jgi:hypothetical protein
VPSRASRVRRINIDKDRIVGAAETLVGNIKQAVGKAVGDQKTVADGKTEAPKEGSEWRRRHQRYNPERRQEKVTGQSVAPRTPPHPAIDEGMWRP